MRIQLFVMNIMSFFCYKTLYCLTLLSKWACHYHRHVRTQ